MKTRYLLIAVMMLSGCATSPPMKTPEQKAAANRAVLNEFDCGVAHVNEVDDRISDARTIAFALYEMCVSEYNAATEAYYYANFDDEGSLYLWRNKRHEQQQQVADFLRIVVMHRNNLLKEHRQ